MPDPDPKPIVPDPGKSYGSDRIRIRNTVFNGKKCFYSFLVFTYVFSLHFVTALNAALFAVYLSAYFQSEALAGTACTVLLGLLKHI